MAKNVFHYFPVDISMHFSMNFEPPASNLYGTHMGPMWAPSWVPDGLPIWDPGGECNRVPCGSHMGCPCVYPYGTHVGPTCADPVPNPRWAAHMGPRLGVQLGPMWVPLGLPMFTQYGASFIALIQNRTESKTAFCQITGYISKSIFDYLNRHQGNKPI